MGRVYGTSASAPERRAPGTKRRRRAPLRRVASEHARARARPAAAGFGAAYLFARRARVNNALLSVGAAVLAGVVLLAIVMVIGVVATA